jgi:translocation and assembly module TamB
MLRMTRRSLWSGVAALLLVSVPLATLLWLVNSQSALQLAVSRVPKEIAGVRLQIEGIRGSLARGVHVNLVRVEHELVTVTVRDLDATVRVLPLLWQSVRTTEFKLADVDIALHPRRTPPIRRVPRFLPELLSITATPVRIDKLTIHPVTGAPVEFDDIVADATLRPRTLRVTESRSRLGVFELQANGLMTAADPLRFDVTARATATPRNAPRWVAAVEGRGDLNSMTLTGGLVEPFRADLRDATLRSFAPWGIDGRALVRDLALERWGASDVFGPIVGELALRIDRDGYRARGALTPTGLRAGRVDVDFFGRYARGTLEVQRLALHHSGSDADVRIDGRIAFPENGPRLELRSDWARLRWPLNGMSKTFASERGRATLEGVWPYAYNYDGDLRLGTLPAAYARASGTLDRGTLRVARGALEVLGGSAETRGELQWRPTLRWAFAGNARNLDPAKIQPTLPGALAFAYAVEGRGRGDGSALAITLRDLGGRLRGLPAQGSGTIKLAGDTLAFERLDLRAGGLRVFADGALAPRARDLRFRILAEDLGVITPQGRGRLQLDGTIRGTAQAPQLQLRGSGEALDLFGVQAQRLEVDVDMADAARGRIALRNITLPGRKLERAEFRLDGRALAHDFALDVQGTDLRLVARGSGDLRDDIWSTRWTKFDLDLASDAELGLVDAFNLRIAPRLLDATRFCLRGRGGEELTGDGTLCAAGGLNGTGWNAALDIRRLPLGSLLAKPNQRASYEGLVDLSAEFGAQGDEPILGKAHADITQARLRWQRVGGKEDLIPLGSGTVHLEATAAGLNGELRISAGEAGRADGSLRTGALGARWREAPLTAALRIDSNALAFVHLYVPEIDRAAGQLRADLEFGGSLGAPLVNGSIRVENGELDLYQVNLALRGVNAEARMLDNGFKFAATGSAGAGRLSAAGELVWRNRLPYGQLRITGNDLKLVDVPEARIHATPDLTFKVDGRDLQASGTVTIPFARIVPADLTGAVLPSVDERRAGEAPPDPAGTFRVTSDLKLLLGDKVTLDSFGLSGRLTGSLAVQTSPGGTNRGSGELGITEGKYVALGRRLDIDRGRLIFSGGLLNDPGVDLRATKEFPDVKAGVNVRGTLRSPRMTFFAEPSLPQSQIVSLIIAGGTLEGARSGDVATSGRSALIAQGSALLAQQLGSKIGIEDVGIEQNLANETSLVLGKYLSSRLYVSYGIALAEAINTIKLRYTLNDRWTLKTEAGKNASADIVYTLEKN